VNGGTQGKSYVFGALVAAAEERAFDQNVIALVKRCRNALAQAVPGNHAMPLGCRGPFVVRVFPGALCGDRKDGGRRAVAARLVSLRSLPMGRMI